MPPLSLIVVDDETQFTEFVRGIAENLGFYAKSATNVCECFDLWAISEPDMIVTDIVMPDIDGIEFISMMAKKESRPKLVFISGYGNGLYIRTASEIARMNGFAVFATISKPVRKSVLINLFSEFQSVKTKELLEQKNIPRTESFGAM